MKPLPRRPIQRQASQDAWTYIPSQKEAGWFQGGAWAPKLLSAHVSFWLLMDPVGPGIVAPETEINHTFSGDLARVRKLASTASQPQHR